MTEVRKRRSVVWKHVRHSEGLVSCTYCTKTFRLTTSTTSILYHLRKEHPSSLFPIPLSLGEGSSGLREEGFSGACAEELLVRFIANNSLPLRLVDDLSFRNFVSYLKPEWLSSLPYRKRLTEVLVPRLKGKVKEQVQKQLQDIEYYSLSLDSWTSIANRKYLAVTIHGICKEWKFHSFLLSLVAVRNSETGEYIAETVEEILEEWFLSKDKLVSVTSDGASNCKNAVLNHLECLWVYCIAHVMNRSVQLGLQLPSVHAILRKARKICKFFRVSAKSMSLLQQQQQTLHLSTNKITLDNKTRWGSTYKMLSRLKEIRSAVSATLAIVQNAKTSIPSDLSDEEWELIDEIIVILEPLHHATEYISSESIPLVSSFLPMIMRLLNHHLLYSNEDEDELTIIDELKKKFMTICKVD